MIFGHVLEVKGDFEWGGGESVLETEEFLGGIDERGEFHVFEDEIFASELGEFGGDGLVFGEFGGVVFDGDGEDFDAFEGFEWECGVGVVGEFACVFDGDEVVAEEEVEACGSDIPWCVWIFDGLCEGMDEGFLEVLWSS